MVFLCLFFFVIELIGLLLFGELAHLEPEDGLQDTQMRLPIFHKMFMEVGFLAMAMVVSSLDPALRVDRRIISRLEMRWVSVSWIRPQQTR